MKRHACPAWHWQPGMGHNGAVPRLRRRSRSLEPNQALGTAPPWLGARGSRGRGSRTGTPTHCRIHSPGSSQPHCCLPGGSETRESSLMAGKHKENSSTNKGEGRELRALPIKNTGHKRRRAQQGGEQGSCTATLPAGTEHVPGCPPCRDCRRGDREHPAPVSTVLLCLCRGRCRGQQADVAAQRDGGTLGAGALA